MTIEENRCDHWMGIALGEVEKQEYVAAVKDITIRDPNASWAWEEFGKSYRKDCVFLRRRTYSRLRSIVVLGHGSIWPKFMII